MTPYQCLGPFDWTSLLTLIRVEFSYMDGRIDPPSSMHRLTEESLKQQSLSAEIWAIGTPPVACVVLTPRPDALYIGKLAVSASHRRQGLARQLIDLAASRAKALGKPFLELETRVELVENQHAFTTMGFIETARSAHAGSSRPTSIIYRRPV